jgi:hypothetical protein
MGQFQSGSGTAIARSRHVSGSHCYRLTVHIRPTRKITVARTIAHYLATARAVSQSGSLGAPHLGGLLRERYRELTSCLNCTDDQARRLNIRFGAEGGKPQFVHMLNGTAGVADEPVVLPEPLRKVSREAHVEDSCFALSQ